MADDVITVVFKVEDEFTSPLSNFGNIITGIKSALDLAGSAFNTFKDIALAGIDAVGQYERIGLALTSLTAAQMVQAGVATDVSAAWDVASIKAGELEEWIQQLAIHSPFTFQGIADSFKTIQVYTGFAAEDTKRLTQALVDFAAGSGVPQEKINLIALALGQISTNGKLAGQDMLQLTSAGVPVLDILADHFNTTKDKIIEMRSQGLLPAQEVIEAITVWMETNFAGAADKFSTSWAGITSTLSDLKQVGLREFFQGLADDIQPALIFLTNFVQSALIPFLGEIGDNIGTKLEPLKKFFEEVNQIQAQSSDIPILSALGVALIHLQGTSDVVKILQDIGSELLVFQGVLNTGGTPLDALNKALDDLSTKWAGSPLGDIVTRIQEFIDTGEKEGWGKAISDLFSDIWSGLDIVSKIQNLVDTFTNVLQTTDWSGVTATFTNILSNIITGAIKASMLTLNVIVTQIDWTPLGIALQGAASEIASGFGKAFWSSIMKSLSSSGDGKNIDWGKIWAETVLGANTMMLIYIKQFISIGQQITNGIIKGIQDRAAEVVTEISNFAATIINTFKKFLGISSPSTVFFQIGKDIIQGLINGIQSMLPTLRSAMKTVENIATGAEVGSGAVAGGILWQLLQQGLGENTGTTGGQTGTVHDVGGTTGGQTGTGGTGTSTGASTVTYNFYGPVYMSGVPAPGTYDCPPNPIIQAGSNQLVTSGY